MNPRRELRLVVVLWLAATAVGLAAVSAVRVVPEPLSQEGATIARAFSVLLVVSVPVLLLVLVPLAYSVVRFRQAGEPTADGPPIRGHRGLELGWVMGSLVLVLSLAAFGWVELASHGHAQATDGALLVQGEGAQWSWTFRYPEHGITASELYLVVGRPTRLELRSRDVLHAFWVPRFLEKQDVLPGRTTSLTITPRQVGTFDAVCAELCGLAHAQMRTRVVVVEPGAFAAWVAQQQADQAASPVAAGRALFQSRGCSGCHSLSDAGSQAAVGPSLDGLTGRAGQRRPGLTAEQYVRQHIARGSQGPTCCVEGFPAVMPPFEASLSEDELDQLTSYLLAVTR